MLELLDNGQIKDSFEFNYTVPIYPLPPSIPPEMLSDELFLSLENSPAANNIQYDVFTFNDCLVMEQEQYNVLTPTQIETIKENRFATWISIFSTSTILMVSKSNKTKPELFEKTIIGNISGATAVVYAINFLNLYDVYTIVSVNGNFVTGESISVDEDYTDAPIIQKIFGVE